MLLRSEDDLNRMDAQYPGIKRSILYFENADLPVCACCGSENTADVQCGVIGRTMYIDVSTTKFKLIPNGPKPGKYYCNACQKFFGEEPVADAPQGSTGKELSASDLLNLLKTHGGFTAKVEGLKPQAETKSEP